MSRKPTKGYFVRGQFVALGSELDLELKRELKGSDDMSKTDLKKYSDRLQQLGESLLTLRADLMQRLDLSEKLVDAVNDAKKITNFEGRRRQMQFIGKLMRGVDEATLAAVEAALDLAAFAPGAEAHPWRKLKALILTGYYTSQPGGAQEIQTHRADGEHQVVGLAQSFLGVATGPQPFGTGPFQESDVLRVVHHATGVGIFPIDACRKDERSRIPGDHRRISRQSMRSRTLSCIPS